MNFDKHIYLGNHYPNPDVVITPPKSFLMFLSSGFLLLFLLAKHGFDFYHYGLVLPVLSNPVDISSLA